MVVVVWSYICMVNGSSSVVRSVQSHNCAAPAVIFRVLSKNLFYCARETKALRAPLCRRTHSSALSTTRIAQHIMAKEGISLEK
jgi:hypothetical protein